MARKKKIERENINYISTGIDVHFVVLRQTLGDVKEFEFYAEDFIKLRKWLLQY
jgi:hypothetical protein